MKKSLLLLVLLLLGKAALYGQFYAPDTEFHDRTQRLFPVEAARVLAWRQNEAGAKIVDVKYKLESKEARETVWKIQWLTAGQKVAREAEIRYPESLLVEGPKYFREVFRQVAGDDWLPMASQPGSIDVAFWAGAGEAGVSRMEAVTAADEFAKHNPPAESSVNAARMAGILAHGAMPLLGTSLTLDSVLLARASAWLCVAEALAGSPDDAAWVPVLFLSGREVPASALWQRASAGKKAERGSAGRFWDLMSRKPSTKECFVFAARKDNIQFAMPTMIYPAQFDLAWMGLLVNLSGEILGEKMTPRLFEYGPFVSVRGGATNATWAASMPKLAMLKWLEVLSDFQPPPGDYAKYQPVMQEAEQAMALSGGDEKLTILALAPLVNQGLDLSRKPPVLIPAMTVTSRDLLGYGWEMAGSQYLGYLHNARAKKLRDQEGAARVAHAVIDHINGLEKFFESPGFSGPSPLREMGRLQFVSSTRIATALVDNPPTGWESDPGSLNSRLWLQKGGMEGIEVMIRGQATADVLQKTVDRMRREGGPMAVFALINYDKDHRYPAVIDLLGLREPLLKELPWACYARTRALELDEQNANSLARARALEKMGWDNLAFPNHYLIFSAYLSANAEASAKRFYEQVQPFINDRAAFAATTGQARYALAWMERDEKTMRRVMEDCGGSSLGDMRIQAIDAILHGDAGRASRVLELSIVRHKGDAESLFRAWLPMLPALLDIKHAEHGRALDEFPDEDDWSFLRWALARQGHLPEADAVRLFREKREGIGRIFAAAARADKSRFTQLYAPINLPPMTRAVIVHEYFKINAAKPLADQSDLKPPGARPIQELVREELRRSGR